jgi:hypothetical protein
MSKNDNEKKPYTATDAASDVVEFVVEYVVVAPVCWLLDKTVGSVLDLT